MKRRKSLHACEITGMLIRIRGWGAYFWEKIILIKIYQNFFFLVSLIFCHNFQDVNKVFYFRAKPWHMNIVVVVNNNTTRSKRTFLCLYIKTHERERERENIMSREKKTEKELFLAFLSTAAAEVDDDAAPFISKSLFYLFISYTRTPTRKESERNEKMLKASALWHEMAARRCERKCSRGWKHHFQIN